jgi:hypothetical protein
MGGPPTLDLVKEGETTLYRAEPYLNPDNNYVYSIYKLNGRKKEYIEGEHNLSLEEVKKKYTIKQMGGDPPSVGTKYTRNRDSEVFEYVSEEKKNIGYNPDGPISANMYTLQNEETKEIVEVPDFEFSSFYTLKGGKKCRKKTLARRKKRKAYRKSKRSNA